MSCQGHRRPGNNKSAADQDCNVVHLHARLEERSGGVMVQQRNLPGTEAGSIVLIISLVQITPGRSRRASQTAGGAARSFNRTTFFRLSFLHSAENSSAQRRFSACRQPLTTTPASPKPAASMCGRMKVRVLPIGSRAGFLQCNLASATMRNLASLCSAAEYTEPWRAGATHSEGWKAISRSPAFHVVAPSHLPVFVRFG